MLVSETKKAYYEANIRNRAGKAVISVSENQGGCWSYVGRVGHFAQFPDNKQHLNIGVWCHRNYIYQHEFYHAAGFLHENQRNDAADHVDFHPHVWDCNHPDKVPDKLQVKFTF